MPQFSACDVRSCDELVAVSSVFVFPVVAYQIAHQRAFWMPQYESLADLFVDAEQVELLTD